MHTDADIGQAWSAHRAYLIDLAFRMLGDIGAAEDVVQEAFFRLVQTPVGAVNDARGWLIVVTSRLCLDHIKSAPWRRERPADMAVRDYRDDASTSVDPADRVTLDDEVRLALLVVLESLTPAERVAYVLHDVFQLPFDVIAETVGRPSAACRQLASRARRKVRESRQAAAAPTEPAGHRIATRRFITACANGDLNELWPCSTHTRPARSTHGRTLSCEEPIGWPVTLFGSGHAPASSWSPNPLTMVRRCLRSQSANSSG